MADKTEWQFPIELTSPPLNQFFWRSLKYTEIGLQMFNITGYRQLWRVFLVDVKVVWRMSRSFEHWVGRLLTIRAEYLNKFC